MRTKFYFLLLLLPFLVGAQTYPAKPINYVTDETGTLTQEQQNTLNAKLKAFEDTTTNQIFVYMAASLNGQDLAQYCEDIFHNWKIGQKDKNNGVLIAVFKDDHKFRIQTGYGLEGALPDLLTKRIQDNDMRPLFKKGDYYGGINAGIDFLAYYSCHAFNPDLIKEQAAPEVVDYGKGTSGLLIGYGVNVILLLILCLVLYGKNAKKRSSTATTVWLIIGIVFALIPCIGGILMFFMCGFLANLKGGGGFSSSSSSWSSSDSSSSWSSSSSSDFGGGGGGDSGGGGSSSDW